MSEVIAASIMATPKLIRSVAGDIRNRIRRVVGAKVGRDHPIKEFFPHKVPHDSSDRVVDRRVARGGRGGKSTTKKNEQEEAHGNELLPKMVFVV